MKLVNCTPHDINLAKTDGSTEAIPSCGIVPRVSTETVELSDEFGFRLVEVIFGEIHDLPDEEENTIFIVSKICVDAAPERSDLVYPTDLRRDETGRVIGCGALSRK